MKSRRPYWCDRPLAALGVDPANIRIVHNGVDVPASSWHKSPEPLFLALGRLVPHKRIDLLLRVWENVRARVGGRLVIAGSGPESTRLEELAGPGVEFAGQISDEEKAALLGEAWMLLHPSMLEGWGLVIMEAAAAGTPTLGFDVPGVRDSVVNGVSGVLARSESDLTEQWVKLASNPALLDQLGAGARRVASNYSWDRTVDAFVDVANEAVGVPTTRTSAPMWALPREAVSTPSTTLTAQTPAVSVIVPAYNEATRLRRSLPSLVDALSDVDAEIILVDDGSGDDTSTVARRLLEGQQSEVVLLPRHRGKGAAVRAGVAAASGSAIAFMDADLATDITHLPDMLVALEESHVVVGSRAAPGAVTIGATFARARMGWTFNQMARLVTALPVSDFQCGFKAFRAPVAKMLFHLSQLDGYAFDVEILMLAGTIGYSITELPVRWEAVPGGHVRPPRDAPLMAADVLKARIRWNKRRVLASVRVSGEVGHSDELAKELGTQLRVFDSVVPWGEGALGLLPFLDGPGAARVAARVQQSLPELTVTTSALPARKLLSPSSVELRHALAAA